MIEKLCFVPDDLVRDECFDFEINAYFKSITKFDKVYFCHISESQVFKR